MDIKQLWVSLLYAHCYFLYVFCRIMYIKATVCCRLQCDQYFIVTDDKSKWFHFVYLCRFAVHRRQHIWSRASIVRPRHCTRKYWQEHMRKNSAKLPVCVFSYTHIVCVCVDYFQSFLVHVNASSKASAFVFSPVSLRFCLRWPLSDMSSLLFLKLLASILCQYLL